MTMPQPIGLWRTKSQQVVAEHGYKEDPVTLASGVCEEAGELMKSVNWFHNPLYTHNPGRTDPHTPEQEIKDCLMFLAGLANALDLDIYF